MTGRCYLKHAVLTLAVMATSLLSSAAFAVTTPAFTLTTPATATFSSTVLGASSSAQIIQVTTTRAVTIASVNIPVSVNGWQEFKLGTTTGCATDGTTASASGAVCSIPVTFAPHYAGNRSQVLSITDTTGAVYTVGLTGFGDGPYSLMTPGSIGTTGGTSPGPFYSGDGGAVASGRFGLPEGVAADASNNLYIADYSTSNIRVVYQAGASLACLIQIEEPTLFGLTVGSTSCAGATSAPVAGNIYTLAGDTTVYATTASTHTTGTSNGVLAASLGATTLYNPSGVVVDSSGNVIVVNYNSFNVRVIYQGGDSMACLIEIENPTLFGLSASATSCTGATSAPQQGFIYTLAGTGAAGITGDGSKASLATMANLYATAISKDGDIYVADDSVQAARTARIRVIYNGGTKAAALITATNPGVTPVLGNIYKVAGGTQISGGDGAIATSGGLIFSRGVAVDADGDLIFTDYNSATVATLANEGKVRVVYNGGARMAQLITLENPSIVTPVAGYLYTIAGNGGTIATPATGNGGLASAAVFTLPYGVTVDPAGDIYVADYTDRTIRRISTSTGIIDAYAGMSSLQGTTLGNALTTGRFWDPFGVTLGSSGTVFVGDYGIYRVRNVSITPADIAFVTAAPTGGQSELQYVYHSNLGNENLTISAIAVTANFSQLPASSATYPNCAVAQVLQPGQTCIAALALTPGSGVSGPVTGTYTITDNSSNSTATNHSVALSGTAAVQTVTSIITSNATSQAGSSVTFTATVAIATGQTVPSGTPALAGTVTFTDGTTIICSGGAIDPVSGQVACSTAALTGTSTHTIKATFVPGTGYSPSSASLSEVINAVNTQTVITSSAPNADPGAPVILTATVSVIAGQTIPSGTPALAGTVTFTDAYTPTGSTTATVSTLASGVAISATGVASTPAITTLAVGGTHLITGVFAPASVFYGASTGTFSQVISPPGWSVSTTSPGVSVPWDSSVAVPFSIASVGAYKGTVTPSCSNLPANLTCGFSPNSVTFAGADNTATLNVYLQAITTTSSNEAHTGRMATELAGILGAAFLFFVPRRRRLGIALMAIFTLALSVGLSGCSNAVNPTRGTFNINVTFTDSTGTVTPQVVPITVSVLGNPSTH